MANKTFPTKDEAEKLLSIVQEKVESVWVEHGTEGMKDLLQLMFLETRLQDRLNYLARKQHVS